MRKSVTQQNCAHATSTEMAELLAEAKTPTQGLAEALTETNEIYFPEAV